MIRQNDQPRNKRHWQAHVKAQKQSGLSRAEYCRQQKLSYHTLSYWCRKSSKPNSREATLVPVIFRHNRLQNPIQLEQPSLKVILPDKIAVEVGDNFIPATLSRLLVTLENR